MHATGTERVWTLILLVLWNTPSHDSSKCSGLPALIPSVLVPEPQRHDQPLLLSSHHPHRNCVGVLPTAADGPQ